MLRTDPFEAIIPRFHCASAQCAAQPLGEARSNDPMFSEALESFAFSACQKRYIISSMSPCGGGRVGATIFLMIIIYHESGKGNALMPRGHFLFRSAGKGSKRGRFGTALRQREANRHGRTRSARRPKTRLRLKRFGRLVFSGRIGKATPVLPLKIPSLARRKRSALLPWPSVSVSVNEGRV